MRMALVGDPMAAGTGIPDASLVLARLSDGAVELDCPADGAELTIYRRGLDTEIDAALEDAAYLVMRARGVDRYSVCLQIAFYETGQRERGEDPTMRAVFGLLPGIDVPVPFDLTWLDGQTLFAPRTLGRLKMTLFGKRMRRGDIETIVISTMPSFAHRRVRIWPCELRDRMPRIVLPRRLLVDELGQWNAATWPGKTRNRAACTEWLRKSARAGIAGFSLPGWDRFGGWQGKRFEATGWFRVTREREDDGTDGRFWLVDPDGNAFISAGVDCVRPGVDTRVDAMRPWLDVHVSVLLDALSAGRSMSDPALTWSRDDEGCDGVQAFYDYGVANLRAAFGEEWKPAWERMAARLLKSWGMNTVGNWSDLGFIRSSGLPYVLPADGLSECGFPSTDTPLFRDFPDVFSEEYVTRASTYAEGLRVWRDDRNMIGYFMRNEPNWAFVYDLNLAEEMLANPAPLASKRRFVDWLRERYGGDVQSWLRAWGLDGGRAEPAFADVTDFPDIIAAPRYRTTTALPGSRDDLKAFSRLLIDRYVRVPAEALRRVDSHHLNLGMRYAYITDPDLLVGSDCYDVFSINSYRRTAYDQIEYVGKLLDMPVMVGEFHHGATDRGLSAHGIRGVESQVERGVAYRYYMEQSARSRYFVGAHYFQFNDQSALGRFDGENYQIGLVDICMREYSAMVSAMRDCHGALYEVADGTRAAYGRIPREVNPIHY